MSCREFQVSKLIEAGVSRQGNKLNPALKLWKVSFKFVSNALPFGHENADFQGVSAGLVGNLNQALSGVCVSVRLPVGPTAFVHEKAPNLAAAKMNVVNPMITESV